MTEGTGFCKKCTYYRTWHFFLSTKMKHIFLAFAENNFFTETNNKAPIKFLVPFIRPMLWLKLGLHHPLRGFNSRLFIRRRDYFSTKINIKNHANSLEISGISSVRKECLFFLVVFMKLKIFGQEIQALFTVKLVKLASCDHRKETEALTWCRLSRRLPQRMSVACLNVCGFARGTLGDRACLLQIHLRSVTRNR